MKVFVIIGVILSAFILLPTPLKVIITIIDFIVPDSIPFADEVVLLLALFVKYGFGEEHEELFLGIKVVSGIFLIVGILLLIFYF